MKILLQRNICLLRWYFDLEICPTVTTSWSNVVNLLTMILKRNTTAMLETVAWCLLHVLVCYCSLYTKCMQFDKQVCNAFSSIALTRWLDMYKPQVRIGIFAHVVAGEGMAIGSVCLSVRLSVRELTSTTIDPIYSIFGHDRSSSKMFRIGKADPNFMVSGLWVVCPRAYRYNHSSD